MRKMLVLGAGFISLLLIVVLVVVALNLDTQPARPLVHEKPGLVLNKPTPNELLVLVNTERERLGVAPLTINEKVQKSAQLKATDFATRDYYAHNVKGTTYTLTEEMRRNIDSKCSSSSENITADRYDASDAVDSWIKSKPHHNAMVNPAYTYTGFGISTDKDGDFYVVQHFCVAK